MLLESLFSLYVTFTSITKKGGGSVHVGLITNYSLIEKPLACQKMKIFVKRIRNTLALSCHFPLPYFYFLSRVFFFLFAFVFLQHFFPSLQRSFTCLRHFLKLRFYLPKKFQWKAFKNHQKCFLFQIKNSFNRLKCYTVYVFCMPTWKSAKIY